MELEVPELPWPLRFGFVRVAEDDGTERWACVSCEQGGPIGEADVEADAFELTAERQRHLDDNRDRYRFIAERRLIPTPENRERSRHIRRAMMRKPREPWTRESLSLLVRDWRALEGDKNGRMWTLADRWGIHRTAVYRALDRAETQGLMNPGERPRRSR